MFKQRVFGKTGKSFGLKEQSLHKQIFSLNEYN